MAFVDEFLMQDFIRVFATPDHLLLRLTSKQDPRHHGFAQEFPRVQLYCLEERIVVSFLTRLKFDSS